MAIGSLAGRVAGRFVFAGYGITAPKYNYDDYAGIDVGGADGLDFAKRTGCLGSTTARLAERETRATLLCNRRSKTRSNMEPAPLFSLTIPPASSGAVERVRNKSSGNKIAASKPKSSSTNLPAEATNSRKTLSRQVEINRCHD